MFRYAFANPIPHPQCTVAVKILKLVYQASAMPWFSTRFCPNPTPFQTYAKVGFVAGIEELRSSVIIDKVVEGSNISAHNITLTYTTSPTFVFPKKFHRRFDF